MSLFRVTAARTIRCMKSTFLSRRSLNLIKSHSFASRQEVDERHLPSASIRSDLSEKNKQLAHHRADRLFNESKMKIWGTASLAGWSLGFLSDGLDFSSAASTGFFGLAVCSAMMCFAHHDSKLHWERMIFKLEHEIEVLTMMAIPESSASPEPKTKQ